MSTYKLSYVQLSAYLIVFGVFCFIVATLLGWFTPLVLIAWAFTYGSFGCFLYGLGHPERGITIVYEDVEEE